MFGRKKTKDKNKGGKEMSNSNTTKIKLITNAEIVELKNMVEGTIAEELVNKLHRSYNAMIIIARDLKRERENNK